jgi:hypothetical protein
VAEALAVGDTAIRDGRATFAGDRTVPRAAASGIGQRRRAHVPGSPALMLLVRGPRPFRTKNSPSRWRFRPPATSTFRLRVLPP